MHFSCDSLCFNCNVCKACYCLLCNVMTRPWGYREVCFSCFKVKCLLYSCFLAVPFFPYLCRLFSDFHLLFNLGSVCSVDILRLYPSCVTVLLSKLWVWYLGLYTEHCTFLTWLSDIRCSVLALPLGWIPSGQSQGHHL